MQWYQNHKILIAVNLQLWVSLNIPWPVHLIPLNRGNAIPKTPQKLCCGQRGICAVCVSIMIPNGFFGFFPRHGTPGTATVQLPSPAEAEHPWQRPVQPPDVHRQPGQPPRARHQQEWWGLPTPKKKPNWELRWSSQKTGSRDEAFPPRGAEICAPSQVSRLALLGRFCANPALVFPLKIRVFFSILCSGGFCSAGNRNVRPVFCALRSIPFPKGFRVRWALVWRIWTIPRIYLDWFAAVHSQFCIFISMGLKAFLPEFEGLSF